MHSSFSRMSNIYVSLFVHIEVFPATGKRKFWKTGDARSNLFLSRLDVEF